MICDVPQTQLISGDSEEAARAILALDGLDARHYRVRIDLMKDILGKTEFVQYCWYFEKAE